MRAFLTALVVALALSGCTIAVETCPKGQDCRPVVNVDAEFCGNIIVGGTVMPVKCPADASSDSPRG